MTSPIIKGIRKGSLERAVSIPWKGLAVATLAAIAITLSLASAPGWTGYLGAGLSVIVMTIAVIDYQSFRIPDWLNGTGLVIALAHAAVQEPDSAFTSIGLALARGCALAVVFLTLRSSYAWLRGREGLGLGDVKLAAVAGAWLGWLFIPIAIQIAAFGALTAYLLQHLVFGRPISATNRLPFGTFFAPAIWMTWLLERYLDSLL